MAISETYDDDDCDDDDNGMMCGVRWFYCRISIDDDYANQYNDEALHKPSYHACI